MVASNCAGRTSWSNLLTQGNTAPVYDTILFSCIYHAIPVLWGGIDSRSRLYLRLGNVDTMSIYMMITVHMRSFSISKDTFE